jgi:hypothetical protein
VTLQEPKNPPSADPDGPDTHVLIPPSAASPVFVDSTGRRRRLLRRASYAFGALCMLYGGLVTVSLAGGPVSPSAVLPLQAEGGDGTDADDALAQPSPIPGPTTTTAAPSRVFVSDQLPHRPAPATHTLERAEAPKPAPAKTSTPKSTPPSAPPSNRPVESATTTPTSSAPPASTPAPSAAPSSRAPAPKPPASPGTPSTGTGGSGGGSTGGSGGGSTGGSGGGSGGGFSGGFGGGEAVAETVPPTAAPRVTPDPRAVIDSAIGSLLDGISPTCPSATGGTEVAA